LEKRLEDAFPAEKRQRSAENEKPGEELRRVILSISSVCFTYLGSRLAFILGLSMVNELDKWAA